LHAPARRRVSGGCSQVDRDGYSPAESLDRESTAREEHLSRNVGIPPCGNFFRARRLIREGRIRDGKESRRGWFKEDVATEEREREREREREKENEGDTRNASESAVELAVANLTTSFFPLRSVSLVARAIRYLGTCSSASTTARGTRFPRSAAEGAGKEARKPDHAGLFDSSRRLRFAALSSPTDLGEKGENKRGN